MSKKKSEEKRIKIQSILFKLRDIGLAILEADMAYRFVMQDILPLINKEMLKTYPVQEIERVFNVLCERANDTRYRKIKKVFILLLRVPKIRKLVVKFLLELDLNKIKLDNADYYFCLGRGDYKFRGKTIEERQIQKKQIDRQLHHNIPAVEIIRQGL